MTFALGLLAFTPVTVFMLPPPPPPPQPSEAIVVLGSYMAVDGILSAASLQRAVYGIQLYRRGLAPLLVTSIDHMERARQQFEREGFAVAPARTLECVGLAVLFVVLNIVLGALLTLLARALTRRFVSLYAVTDSVLMGLSVLEAVAVRWWWAGAGNGQEKAPAQEVVRMPVDDEGRENLARS